MNVELHAVRIYATTDQYGDKPGIYNGKNPIVFDNYPNKDESLVLYFGFVPEEIILAHTSANARGKVLFEWMFTGKQFETELEEAVVQEASVPIHSLNTSKYNWYVTIIVAKKHQISDEEHSKILDLQKGFHKYAFGYIDLVSTHLSTVLPVSIFQERLIKDRIFFSTDTLTLKTIPEFSLTAITPQIITNNTLDYQKVEDLLTRLTKAPKQNLHWMNSFKNWYINSLFEADPWKKFMWNFFCIEILTNKLSEKFYKHVVNSLTLGDSELQLPLDILVLPHDRLSIKAKFVIVATHLSPETAMKDVAEFSAAKKFRDNLSHGGLVEESEIPQNVQSLVYRYVQKAVQYFLN